MRRVAEWIERARVALLDGLVAMLGCRDGLAVQDEEARPLREGRRAGSNPPPPKGMKRPPPPPAPPPRGWRVPADEIADARVSLRPTVEHLLAERDAEIASLRAQLAEQERRAERWKWKYGNRRSVIARWHDQAVALGYDGVDDLLAATPERAQAAPSVPEFDTSDVEAVRRLFHRGPHGEDTLVDHTILGVLRAADTHRAQRAEPSVPEISPDELLSVARRTGLREYLHALNATDARAILARYVAAIDANRAQTIPQRRRTDRAPEVSNA